MFNLEIIQMSLLFLIPLMYISVCKFLHIFSLFILEWDIQLKTKDSAIQQGMFWGKASNSIEMVSFKRHIYFPRLEKVGIFIR